jgi:colanic acid/amylovoran biosynthesis glycosyltransferase
MANWRLARSLRIPHVTTFYGADIWLHSQRPGWREKFLELAANSEMFLVEGNAMRDKVISLGAAPKRVKIFHLGLDLAKIQFSPRRPAPGGKIHILMSGRAYEKKGHIYGLRAFAQLAPKHPRLHLDMIIGGESAKAIKGAAEMREFIRVNNLADRITWSEMLPYDEYLRRLAGAHIFLQPSVMAADGDAEGGFPVTLTEMSAVGVPIVATRHCDIPEAVLHERTGLLASERDVEGLAAHLERLIQTPELWLAYGQAGREHVEANYNIRTTIDVLEDCYRQLLKPAGPSL